MRLSHALSLVPVILVAAVLSGCSMFGDDEEVTAGGKVAIERRPEPIQALRNIEIGRTRNGYAVSAFGTAQTTGYGGATLQARREGQPGIDGFIDFDFVAIPPDPALNMPQGGLTAREIRADTQLSDRKLRGVAGIRVHTLSNSGQVGF